MKYVVARSLLLSSITALLTVIFCRMLASTGETVLGVIDARTGFIAAGIVLLLVGAAASVGRIPAAVKIISTTDSSRQSAAFVELRNLLIFQGVLLFGFVLLVAGAFMQ